MKGTCIDTVAAELARSTYTHTDSDMSSHGGTQPRDMPQSSLTRAAFIQSRYGLDVMHVDEANRCEPSKESEITNIFQVGHEHVETGQQVGLSDELVLRQPVRVAYFSHTHFVSAVHRNQLVGIASNERAEQDGREHLCDC